MLINIYGYGSSDAFVAVSSVSNCSKDIRVRCSFFTCLDLSILECVISSSTSNPCVTNRILKFGQHDVTSE